MDCIECRFETEGLWIAAPPLGGADLLLAPGDPQLQRAVSEALTLLQAARVDTSVPPAAISWRMEPRAVEAPPPGSDPDDSSSDWPFAAEPRRSQGGGGGGGGGRR